MVRASYREIAVGASAGCCDERALCGCGIEDYQAERGYFKDADLNLGCGIPTRYAGLRPGMTVLDLGSGAGNDVFVARGAVKQKGTVIGMDFTGAMVRRAKANCDTLGYENVRFVKGDIERIPLGNDTIDAILSNCVINLVADKRQVFTEAFRVLRPGGHFCVSDVVVAGELPAEFLVYAELYAGCVAGAVSLEEYESAIEAAGFEAICVAEKNRLTFPASAITRTSTRVCYPPGKIPDRPF